MAFQLAQFKSYGVRCEGALRQQVVQVAEFGINALLTDTLLDIGNVSTTPAPLGTPALGTARTFGGLSATALTNTGSTVITGNIGVYPGTAITGFPPGTYTGTENIANSTAAAAQASALAAYTDLQSRPSTVIASALDGQTLTAGVYSFASGAATLATSAPGTLTLNGTASSVFVIQTASTITTGAGGAATIALTGGALASNVYFVVGSSATINVTSGSTFNGNIIALTAITVGSGTVNGSLIALNAAVTFSAATTVTTQALPVTPGLGTFWTQTQADSVYGSLATKALSQILEIQGEVISLTRIESEVLLLYNKIVIGLPTTFQWLLSLSNHLPIITFNSGYAPLSQILCLTWLLHDNTEAVVTDLGAAF